MVLERPRNVRVPVQAVGYTFRYATSDQIARTVGMMIRIINVGYCI